MQRGAQAGEVPSEAGELQPTVPESEMSIARTNRLLDEMYSKPGVYVLVGASGLFFVEVDSSHVCHQLRYGDYKKDGVLDRSGWFPETLKLIHGPLPFKEDR